MRRRYTGEQRSELIELVSSGRANLHGAADRVGVTYSTACRWVKRSRTALIDGKDIQTSGAARPAFAKLIRASEVNRSICVRVGVAAIEVERGFDAALLRLVVDALSGERDL